MKAKITLISAVTAVFAAALIPASLAGPSKGSSASVAVARTQLGRILVDGRGHTLYLFEKDRRGRSSCNGACAATWPPLIASGKPRAKSGVRASLLGRTKRTDGRWQVTYNRHPLYTFVRDTNKGQTTGEGVDAFGAEWYVVSPRGTKVEADGRSSTGGDASTPGGYGGYGPYGP
jgi:predicted lipoprotein with Yx(FWY)xxD motif